jgi:hypothetical protein
VSELSDPCFDTTVLEEGIVVFLSVGRTLDVAGAVVEREVSRGLAVEKRDGGGGVSSFLDREVKDGDLETALNDVAGEEREISRV